MRSSADLPQGLPCRPSIMRLGIVISAARISRDSPITFYSGIVGDKVRGLVVRHNRRTRASARLVGEVAAARLTAHSRDDGRLIRPMATSTSS